MKTLSEAVFGYFHDECLIYQGKRYNKHHPYYKSAKKYGTKKGKITTGLKDLEDTIFAPSSFYKALK